MCRLFSRLSQEQFLYLTTKGWKTGHNHQIEIWFVQHDRNYYIMSEGHEQAHWVQNILHNPAVSFRVGSKTFKGAARIVDKQKVPKLTDQVAKLMAAKYGWDQGLIVEPAPG